MVKGVRVRRVDVQGAEGTAVEGEQESSVGSSLPTLLCPVTLRELEEDEDGGYVSPGGNVYKLSADGYLDLTLETRMATSRSGGGVLSYEERQRGVGVEVFQSPVVSFLYERGWRQGFARAGFPGVDAEFETAMRYFESGTAGLDAVLDLSCGSGLFTRRFAHAARFGAVVALDLSETMLREANQRLRRENESALLIRGDVARLPIATDSMPCVHAGAAIHCWPSPLTAVAEVYRILAPGGVFVLSTFLEPIERIAELANYDEGVGELVAGVAALQKRFASTRATPGSSTSIIRYWCEQELRSLLRAVGFVDYERTRSGQYIQIACRKE